VSLFVGISWKKALLVDFSFC